MCMYYLIGKTVLYVNFFNPANVKKYKFTYRSVFYIMHPIHEGSWSALSTCPGAEAWNRRPLNSLW